MNHLCQLSDIKVIAYQYSSIVCYRWFLCNFRNFLTIYPVLAFREVFDLFDSNGGGTIDAEELDLALKSVDITLSHDEIHEVLFAMDKDGTFSPAKPSRHAVLT